MSYAKHAALSLVAALVLVLGVAPSSVHAQSVSPTVQAEIASGNATAIAAAMAAASPQDAQAIANAVVASNNATLIANVTVASVNAGGAGSASSLAMTTAMANSTNSDVVKSVFASLTTSGLSAGAVSALVSSLANAPAPAGANPNVLAAINGISSVNGTSILTNLVVGANGNVTAVITVTLPNPNQVAQQQGTPG